MKLLRMITIAGLCFATACQTIPYQGQARETKKRPGVNGVLALPNNPRAEDRTKAEQTMRSNCAPRSYKVVEEGEIVVGQNTVSDSSATNREKNEHQVGKLFGVPVVAGDAGGTDTSVRTKTEAIKEWQIAYECTGKSKTQ
ncbi:MAG: hypothetical protein AB7H97_00115 [Pseudobdellovibrionaceae bacterium]